MRTILSLIFLLIISNAFAQSVDTDTTELVYEVVTEDYFKDFPYANLILDYYYTDGISYGDRYSYEIIMVDSLCMLGFNSPGTDSYKFISYEKKFLLEDTSVSTVIKTLEQARLTQAKNGVPRATYSAHIREVLIVRYKSINIAGGFAYANTVSYPESEFYEETEKKIDANRKQSSSIGGDYDLLIRMMKTYFQDLDELKNQSINK